jgi:4-hydroxybenzoate polyprenyltransferase
MDSTTSPESSPIPPPGASLVASATADGALAESLAPERTLGSLARGLVVSARPVQWTKNAAVLGGLIFSPKVTQPGAIAATAATFAATTLCASAVYLVNDVLDVAADRAHPVKRRRPIASGVVPPRVALAAALVAVAAAFLLAWAVLPPSVGVVLAIYAVQSIAYSLWLKNVVIVDVMTIAIGFVLRIMAGVYAIEDPLTPWIVLCAFFLALLLAFGKRRREADRQDPHRHRRVLGSYPQAFLDQMILSSATLSIGAYTVFTLVSHKTASLVLTVPLVVFGIARYLYVLSVTKEGEDPSSLILRDGPTLGVCVAWIALSVALLHWSPAIFFTP